MLAIRGEHAGKSWCPRWTPPRKTTRAASRQPCHKHLIFLRKPGAGEGIRTLDPNLGKVVLYP